ncbi:MAG: hypothetical protein WCP14_04035 [bacterium]
MEKFSIKEFRKERLKSNATRLHTSKNDPTVVRDALKQEIVGSGAEKVVFVHPYDDEKVVSVKYEREGTSAKSARMNFWLQKILHLLYEDKIPDIHASYSNPSTTITEKINGKSGLLPNLRAKFLGDHEKRKLEFQLDSLSVGIDTNDCNFVFDEKGIPVYVDGYYFCVWADELKNRINLRLHGAEKKSALRYLERLIIADKIQSEGP